MEIKVSFDPTETVLSWLYLVLVDGKIIETFTDPDDALDFVNEHKDAEILAT